MHPVVREPRIESFEILELRPTQITYGAYQVAKRRKHWKKVKEAEEFLGRHLIPVVHGYKERYYIIDHHHLSRALYEEGVKKVGVTILADLTKLSKDDFWYVMDHKAWVHPFAFGKRLAYDDLPKSVDKLEDDPFRSLAGELRHAGGFSKETAPYSEFLWGNFLRGRLKRKEIEADFEGALREALVLAKGPEADYLPGWCGPC